MSDETAYTTQIDDAGTYTYIGEAGPGTSTSSASWRIQRITNSTGVVEYAATGSFSQIWTSRTSLTYS